MLVLGQWHSSRRRSKTTSDSRTAGMDAPGAPVADVDDDGVQRPLSIVAQRSVSNSSDKSSQGQGPGQGTPSSTIRTVSPEAGLQEGKMARSQTPTREQQDDDIFALQASPRSIVGGEKSQDRRQGLIFENCFDASDSSPRQPPPPGDQPTRVTSPTQQFNSRPRTRTLDDARRVRLYATTVSKTRRRVGSIHSSSSTSYRESNDELLPDASISTGLPSSTSQVHPPPIQSGRRLFKKSFSARPVSPLILPTPSVDSLPAPVPVTDANRVLRLMRVLAGRMRGIVEYQLAPSGSWVSGICYIDDVKGALMCEGEDQGPFHHNVVPDLRGCRVRPMTSTEKPTKCLHVTTQQGCQLLLCPQDPADVDQWLAAFLSWQQIRPGGSQISLSTLETFDSGADTLPRTQSSRSLREATVIKVGKLQLWDKGSPTIVGGRFPAKDTRSSLPSWRRVACTLQDNGELRLFTESDATMVSVIQLSQLSRCAIQQLDRTVLNEEYCIAIFPQYSPASTFISLIRPVYISLETRVLFEVWFVLLRAFTIPEIYGPPPIFDDDGRSEITQNSEAAAETEYMFRIEKSLRVRVVEAKVRKATKLEFLQPTGKHAVRPEQDPVVGDYFAEVILDGETRSRTMTKANTRNPFWREECIFNDLPATLPELSVVLKRKAPTIEAKSHGQRSSSSLNSPDLASEVVCGFVQIDVDRIERAKDSETWWPILDDRNEAVGEMFLKIRHDELVVLLAKDYAPISELLHRFSNSLTVQIAHIVPSNLRYLSEILMNIFQVSGQANNWLMSLVEDEIDGIMKEMPTARFRFNRRVGSNDSFESVGEREQSVRDMGKSLTGEANLLFRGNSLLTQALDFHMRRLGKEYLEEVLRDKILEIDALDPNCEVDPSRLGHGDDISKNWSQLKKLTSGIWESIACSATRCPPGLRQILKYIRAVADDRYGDFLRNVPYTSVSGFLFLRFFCPAILNPKLFDLLRDHPRPKAQRTLTLIAKSLQVLANLSTFGQKESWMEPMNRFLASNRQGVKDFIDEICDLPADRNIFALPASYSTPMTILGRLPPTSKEGFPSLPYLVDHARNYAALAALWLESIAPYLTIITLEGDLLRFHELCQDLRRRAAECLARAAPAALDQDDDAMSQHWDDLSDSLERTRLQPLDVARTLEHGVGFLSHTSFSPTPQLPPLPASASKYFPTGSTGSASNETERKDRHSFWDATFGKDLQTKSPRGQQGFDVADDLAMSASPPSRGVSRNGFRGRPKIFLGLAGLRKRSYRSESSAKKSTTESEPETEPQDFGGSSSVSGGVRRGSAVDSTGGMI